MEVRSVLELFCKLQGIDPYSLANKGLILCWHKFVGFMSNALHLTIDFISSIDWASVFVAIGWSGALIIVGGAIAGGFIGGAIGHKINEKHGGLIGGIMGGALGGAAGGWFTGDPPGCIIGAIGGLIIGGVVGGNCLRKK